MIEAFDALWSQARPAFRRRRGWQRGRALALGSLVALGRRTVGGLLCATGQQFRDWSAAYRLFERERFEPQALFAPARRAVAEALHSHEPMIALIDDTLTRKRGRKVWGAAYRRDPLGPPFRPNLVWAQRFMQICAVLPEADRSGAARAIPIDLRHCPTPAQPRQDATALQWQEYRRRQKAMALTQCAIERARALRQALDEDGQKRRPLILVGDGGYTNGKILRALPQRTALIGRLRKDAKLYALPQAQIQGPGRKRFYGAPLPTPERIRQDPTIPWQTVRAFAAARWFDFHVKCLRPVRWRGAQDRDLTLLIVRPLAYRPSAQSKLLYRSPAYLVCSDPNLPLQTLLQAYLWRIEIELNFRDLKTLLGFGQAPVRTEPAVLRLPALIAAAYAFLHLAIPQAFPNHDPNALWPTPKWQRKKNKTRLSTANAIGLLRQNLWGQAIHATHLPHFEKQTALQPKSLFFTPTPQSAIFYASG